jgi:hypothetical protein
MTEFKAEHSSSADYWHHLLACSATIAMSAVVIAMHIHTNVTSVIWAVIGSMVVRFSKYGGTLVSRCMVGSLTE